MKKVKLSLKDLENNQNEIGRVVDKRRLNSVKGRQGETASQQQQDSCYYRACRTVETTPDFQ